MIFDHAGIVVRDIDRGERSISRLLPIKARTERFDDATLGVSVRFLRDANNLVFELIAPLGLNSPVAKIASSRSGVINQLAYRVKDLTSASKYFRFNGAVPTGVPKAAVAFDGASVQFFLTPEGFVIELIEALSFSHRFEDVQS